MTLLLTFKTTIKCCARCQGDHVDLEFSPLANPGEIKATHWAACPANGQPILLKTVNQRAPSKSRFTPSIKPAFDRFWDAYPKKKSKGHAMTSFSSEMAQNIEELLAALKWQKASPDWTKDGGQYIPNPATWLRGRRWEDQPMKPISPAGKQLEFRTARSPSDAELRKSK